MKELFLELDHYINIHHIDETSKRCFRMSTAPTLISDNSIDDWIDDNYQSEGFIKELYMIIDQKNLNEVEVYKRAGLNRKLFSKMRNQDYHPSKKTVFCLIIALELDIEQSQQLLRSSGYQFANTNLLDCIIEFFIIKKIYDFELIDEALVYYNLPTLRSKE